MKLEQKIYSELNNKSVKEILKICFDLSNRLIVKLKTNKQIYCNNIPCYVNHIVKENDIISINLSLIENENDNIVPIKNDINILFEDESLIIIDKPANTPTHPSILHYDDTLSNYLKYYFNTHNINIPIRPINRLDKNTSGIILFAKNQYIQEQLIKQMKNNEFKKEYTCIVNGIIEKNSDTINLPIARKENSIIERCINESGQKAITHYTVIQKFENYTLINVFIETGRTHQIRVHFSHIGHPILGDELYGSKSELITRQALHCSKVTFNHPITKKEIIIQSDLPNDIKKLIE